MDYGDKEEEDEEEEGGWRSHLRGWLSNTSPTCQEQSRFAGPANANVAEKKKKVHSLHVVCRRC